MPELFRRHPANPVLRPGGADGPAWRMSNTFNPGAIVGEDGRTYLLERTAGGLRPFVNVLGLQVSDDGIHFERVGDEPVWTPTDCGSPLGSVQDPRLVTLDGSPHGRYAMTFAYRPFAWHSMPTGVGVPESFEPPEGSAPGYSGDPTTNLTRSGLAVSDDLRTWRLLGWVNPTDYDDRNCILFPRKVNGRWLMLRRPQRFDPTTGGLKAYSDEVGTGIFLSDSDDLIHWSEPRPIVRPQFEWEDNRIGGSTPPVETDAGWLVTYHAVQTEMTFPAQPGQTGPRPNRVCYRMGLLLLDRDDPSVVLARTKEPVLEPTEYYEKTGLYLPNVVFPTGLIRRDDELWLYYGCCDTCVALAVANLPEVMKRLDA
jgi:predicted GH43/DUF377 family glycosyl hydrolase